MNAITTMLLFIVAALLAVAGSILPARGEPEAPNKIILKYNVSEELPIGTLVGDITSDGNLRNLKRKTPTADNSNNNDLQFDIFSGAHRDFFRVETASGLLRTNRVLDRELICIKKPLCMVQFVVSVVGPDQFFRMFRVEVAILDVNDNFPKFQAPKVVLKVSESSPVGSTIVLPTAYDLDSESFGLIRYEYYVNNSSDVTLQTVSTDEDGASDIRLVIAKALDRETKSSYSMLITAFDGGRPSKSGTMEVTIVVQDVNDNVPVFEQSVYNLTVLEDFPLATSLVRVQAFDPDDGANGRIHYSLSQTSMTAFGSIFSVNNTTGVVSLIARLDFQREQEHVLFISANDMGQGALPVYAKLIISVQDVNDNAPVIRVKTRLEVIENEPIGTFVSHVTVDDSDSGPGGQVVCAVIPSAEFRLVPLPSVPMAYRIITNVVFDRERRNEYRMNVSCRDQGEPQMTSSQEIDVQISDSNDNSPKFEQDVYSVTVHENNSLFAIILRVTATDRDLGENATVSYRLDHASSRWLSVDAVTGIISAAGVFDYEEASEYEFYVIATDGGRSQSRWFNFSLFDYLPVS